MHTIAALIGSRLRELRRAREWTQTKLAYEAHLTAVTVNKVEGARCMPSVETLIALAGALDCSLDDLVPRFATRAERGRTAVGGE